MADESDVALLGRIADEAAGIAAPLFRRAIAIETKADHSPVTEADRGIERAIRALLARERPKDAILGEEFGASGPPGGMDLSGRAGGSGAAAAGPGRLWVIDPIDGTRSFICGKPLFGTLVALVEHGYPTLGLISASAAGDRWLGSTAGTTLNGARIKTRPCPSLAKARAATTSPYLFSEQGRAAFERLRLATAEMSLGGDCYHYGLLATGFLDLVVEEGLHPYDWAALVPVVEGAGGVITDWEGRPLRLDGDGRVLAAGDRRLHQQALALLAAN